MGYATFFLFCYLPFFRVADNKLDTILSIVHAVKITSLAQTLVVNGKR